MYYYLVISVLSSVFFCLLFFLSKLCPLFHCPVFIFVSFCLISVLEILTRFQRLPSPLRLYEGHHLFQDHIPAIRPGRASVPLSRLTLLSPSPSLYSLTSPLTFVFPYPFSSLPILLSSLSFFLSFCGSLSSFSFLLFAHLNCFPVYSSLS